MKISIEKKSREIQKLISRYSKESFVCFFADFIRHHTERKSTGFSQKFKSKLKDSLYLIMLRLSSDREGSEELTYNEENDRLLSEVADRLLEIVGSYLGSINNDFIKEVKDDRHKRTIHELAFMDYFQNGVLNYREQEINKVIRLFKPYREQIKNRLGIELKTLINICNYSEKVYQEKSIQNNSFILDKKFIKLREKLKSGKISSTDFIEEIESFSDDFLEKLYNFHERPHSSLLFTKEDYEREFDSKDVHKFCDLFSINIKDNFDYLYYSEENPLELKPIIKINDLEYLNICQKQLPTALYKLLFLTLTKNDKEKERLNRRKGKVVLEEQTKEVFSKFFDEAKNVSIYSNYYINDNPEEKDLLILADNNAYIIECKASRNREPRRNFEQAYQRIESDFRDCIQKGYYQCYQVEELIINNENTVIKSNGISTYLSTSYINEIFSIIVTSERFASIQSDLGLLLKKENELGLYPWSVSIDDLEIFLKGLRIQFNNPVKRLADFLEYRELLHERLFTRDELDLCSLYLQNPPKFKKTCESSDYIIADPKLQNYFDKLYFTRKLKFKLLKL